MDRQASKVVLLSYRITAALVLVLHAAMLAWIDWRTSPNRTEIGHMTAGLYTWNTLKFDVFHVNPPLIRLAATGPVALCRPQYDWGYYSPVPHDRCEWGLGFAFCRRNGEKALRWYFPLARWTIIPLSLLGAAMCCRLAGEMFGRAAGLCALILWCFSPMLVGWGATICPDVGAAAIGVAALWAFRRWLLAPHWPRALAAGLLLGLLPLTKLTWLVALVLWPALWLLWQFAPRNPRRFAAEVCQLGAILVLALYVTNLGYIFEGTFQALGQYQFTSKALSGIDNTATKAKPVTGNRFVGTWLGEVPVPLPANLVQGIDTQRFDFEKGQPSYVRGHWSDHGWWWYYLYALAVKVPLGTSCLVALAAGLTLFGQGCRASWRDEMLLLVPLCAILILVSSQTGFSGHSRYVIPALPLLLVWTSKVGRVFESRRPTRWQRAVAAAVAVGLTWSVGSSLFVYPHSQSYFNELAGGPRHGAEHLLGSEIDHGQDLLYLKDWLDRHADVKLDGLAYDGAYPANLAGIPETPAPPPGPGAEQVRQGPGGRALDLGPRPGWYALSVNSIRNRSGQFEYFLRFKPAATAGYSIYIYHITPEDANRVRLESNGHPTPTDLSVDGSTSARRQACPKEAPVSVFLAGSQHPIP